jgi:hypothetical protein
MNIHDYSLFNVGMKKSGIFINLAIPGLAEKRPSILKGDFILAEQVNFIFYLLY